MPRRKIAVTNAALDERALDRRLKTFRQWIAATREADAFRQILRDRLIESRERARQRRAYARINRDIEERHRLFYENSRRENPRLHRSR